MAAANCSFRIERDSTAERPRFALIGTIDERSNLTIPGDVDGELELELSELDGINSFGVGIWISAMERLTDTVQVHLLRCPPIIVNHMNLTAGFVAKATIVSFQVPFACDECDEETDVDFEVAAVKAAGGALPESHPCECGADMFADVLSEMYLRFLDE